MTVSIEESIEKALLAYAAELDLDGAPLAWPNVDFPGAGNEKPATYIDVRHLPNVTSRLFAKGSNPHLRQGILQLTVVTPLNGGATPATALAGSIAGQFPADLELFEGGIKVRIQTAATVMQPSRTDVSWDVPVSVRYEAFA